MERAVAQAHEAGLTGVVLTPGRERRRHRHVPRVDAGYGEQFIHRTRHGIGLTTHEPRYKVEGETQLLRPGICFSIEPRIYMPGRFGVRIEDIVTVTDDGRHRLNTSSRERQVVA